MWVKTYLKIKKIHSWTDKKTAQRGKMTKNYKSRWISNSEQLVTSGASTNSWWPGVSVSWGHTWGTGTIKDDWKDSFQFGIIINKKAATKIHLQIFVYEHMFLFLLCKFLWAELLDDMLSVYLT